MELAGTPTKRALFLNVESHKLMLGFPLASGASFKKGQPLKLTATGEVTPLLAADAAYLKIGTALHDSTTKEPEITVIMKAHLVITTISGAALNAGPVKFSAMGTGDNIDRSIYVAATDIDTTQGWALDNATAAGQEIQVALY